MHRSVRIVHRMTLATSQYVEAGPQTENTMPAEAAFWNNLAEKYAARPVSDPSAFERKIAITKSRMRPADEILEIGCGTGSLALRLAPHARQIHGLDVSDEMLRIAEGKVTRQGIDNVSFHVGPFDRSFDKFEAGSLDGILAYSILHLLEDVDDALKQIYDLLRPGGFFISSTVCLANTWVPYKSLITVMRWLGKAPMVRSFTTDTLLKSIRRAGFVDVECPDVGAKNVVGFVVAAKPG